MSSGIDTMRAALREYDTVVTQRDELRDGLLKIMAALNMYNPGSRTSAIPSTFSGSTSVEIILQVLEEHPINAHDLNAARKARGL